MGDETQRGSGQLRENVSRWMSKSGDNTERQASNENPSRENNVITVDLESWEYEWASHVGARRYIENWERGDAAHYDRNRMQDDRTAQVAACVAELAVAKCTNKYWSGHVWKVDKHDQYKHIADVGKNIEVKRVRTSTSAAVRRRQNGLGLVLFVVRVVEPELRSAEILGWISQDLGWAKGSPSDYDPENTRVIREECLNSPMNYNSAYGEEGISV